MSSNDTVSRGCSLSHLLKRSLDLIDPPRYSVNNNNSATDSATTATPPADQAAVALCAAPDGRAAGENETNPRDPSAVAPLQSTAVESSSRKTVRFSESCSPPRKIISPSDAIQAYDLLMHAASIIDGGRIVDDDGGIDASTIGWKRLTDMADIYRALLVTCCLLMELLPPDISTTNISDESPINSDRNDQTPTKSEYQHCPLKFVDSLPCIPSLSPEIEKILLSTSRRCILLLQALERICAAKTISQRHSSHIIMQSNSGVTTTSPQQHFVHASYEGGDDIHDYERSTSDLYSNYDWHDDGFLPHYSSSSIHDKNEGVYKIPSSEPKHCSNGSTIDGSSQSRKTSNILQECCYRPQYFTDAPSSKLEKSAWTRHWIRGDRVISLCLEDYRWDCNGDVEHVKSEGGENMIAIYNDDKGVIDNISTESNLAQTKGANSSDIIDEQIKLGDVEEEQITLNISQNELAEEEECLLHIMLAVKGSSPHNSHSYNDHSQHPGPSAPTNKRVCNAKARRKKKRKKKKKPKQFETQDGTNDALIYTIGNIDPIVRAKEGFLLLVIEEAPNSIYYQRNTHQSENRTNTVRVFARLHPSGWLSIEDRSITLNRQYNPGNEEFAQKLPLPHRIRYFDLFVGPATKCHPSLPEDGASSFHFRLDCISLLGASSLCQLSGGDTSLNRGTAATKRVDILFSVDEETGGAFVDGFGWVTALSGAASIAKSLQENIRSEFGEESV